MLFICHMIVASMEMAAGVGILYQIYGKNEYQERIRVGICLLGYFLITIAHIINMWDSYISNNYILFESILLGILFSWFFRVQFSQVFIIEMLYWINLSLFKLPIMILEGMKFHASLSDINRGMRTLQEYAWSMALLILICFGFAKNRKKKKNRETQLLILGKHIKFFAVIAILLWCTLSYNMWLGLHMFQPVDLLVNLFFIIVTQIYTQYLMLRLVQREVVMENQRLDMVQEILQRRNTELHELYNKNREYMHEIYHNTIYVYHCLEEFKLEEAKEFLQTFLKGYENTKRRVWTGLPFFDFLLNYKKEEMDQKCIDFQLDLDVYEYPFEDVELGIVLGNLLDNAIEASEKCAEGRRYIRMRAWNFHRIFILRLCNSSIKKPLCMERKFVTDKLDTGAHGMGVRQVERIINKYGGDIEFRYDDGHFEVNIMVSK